MNTAPYSPYEPFHHDQSSKDWVFWQLYALSSIPTAHSQANHILAATREERGHHGGTGMDGLCEDTDSSAGWQMSEDE